MLPFMNSGPLIFAAPKMNARALLFVFFAIERGDLDCTQYDTRYKYWQPKYLFVICNFTGQTKFFHVFTKFFDSY